MADSLALPAWRVRISRALTGPRGQAVAAGALAALGAPPYNLWPIALLGLVLGFVMFRRCVDWRDASWTGWFFGLGYFGLGLHWIIEPFLVDAALTGWMAPFGLIGLAGGLALFWALAFGCAARLGGFFALVVSLSLAELARGYVLTGFPWALVGYLWLETPAIQWVSAIGSYGLTVLTFGFVALVAFAGMRRDVLSGVFAVGLLALLLGVGWRITPPVEDLSDRPVVRLVQPNAPQDEKWRRDLIPMFYNRLLDLTELPAERPLSLIVWPETALPMLLHQAESAFGDVAFSAKGVPVILGIQRVEEGRFYNSLVTLDSAGQQTQLYDKFHLVPFGEYMPAPEFFARFNIMGLAARAEAGYSPGPGAALLDFGPLGRALPLICYEAVFPQDLRGAPERPDWLVQITNDAWFGNWSGPQQHLAQARIRAIEQGLPLLRSANTGISAVIDPAGRIIDSLPLNVTGIVDVPLPSAQSETVYSRNGDLPIALILGFALIGITIGRLRR